MLSKLEFIPNIPLYQIGTRYQSLDRGGLVDPHDREFVPIREPRDRSRDRSLERGLYLEEELYGRSRQSPNPMSKFFFFDFTMVKIYYRLLNCLIIKRKLTFQWDPIEAIWVIYSIKTAICSVNWRI